MAVVPSQVYMMEETDKLYLADPVTTRVCVCPAPTPQSPTSGTTSRLARIALSSANAAPLSVESSALRSENSHLSRNWT
jgi:hypothetical protein